MRRLHPYGKAIAGAVTAAISATLAAYADLPPWVGIVLGTVGTLVTIYFAANSPAETPAPAEAAGY